MTDILYSLSNLIASNIDATIVVVFLVITLIVGLGHGQKVKNIKDYALGGRNFSTAALVATIVATWASGQAFFTILEETYNTGLYFIWSVMGYILCLLTIGLFLAPRLGEFLGKLSIAEAMGELYGKHVRIVTVISSFIASGGMIALQLKVSGFIFGYCFRISEIYGIIIGGIIVTMYSAFGGIKSITFTDVIQFFTFSAMIPALALFILGTLDNTDILLNTISNNELFDYKKVFDFTRPQSLYFVFLFLFNAIPAFNPAFFQRISMAKDTIQVGRSFIISAFVCLFITLTISFISIIVLSADDELNITDITGYIFSNYSYLGLNGIILAGIMAMVMSTADSYINSTSILFVHDFCKPLKIKVIKDELTFSKFASALLGVISILLALSSGSLLQMIISANMLYMPIVTVPFIMSVFGFRSSSKSVLIGMGAGFITIIIWKLFLETNIDALVPGMVMNLVFLIGSHYLLKQDGGWVGIKDDKPLRALKQVRILRLKRFKNFVLYFNLIDFFRKNSPNTEISYVYFGLFCIISLYSNMYTIPKEIKLHYSMLMSFITLSILFLATALLSYSLWPINWKEKSIIAIIWNVVSFYVLICIGFLFVIITNFAPLQVMILMINLILISVMTRWQWALFMIVIGLYSVTKFFNIYLAPGFAYENILSFKLKLIYLLLLISSTLIAFLKPKQDEYELNEKKANHLGKRITFQDKEISKLQDIKNEFLRNLPHEVHTPVTGITSMAQALHAAYDKLTKEQILSYLEVIAKSAHRFDSVTRNITDLSKLSSLTYKLDRRNVNLSNLVHERLELCKKLYLDGKELEFVPDVEKDIIANIDKYYIEQLLDNLITNAITYSKEGAITIALRKRGKKVEFSIKDEGIGIPIKELKNIFGAFVVSTRTKSPAEGRGIGLALCHKIVSVHGGEIKAESDGKKGATLTFILQA